jgi:hypothetical protein
VAVVVDDELVAGFFPADDESGRAVGAQTCDDADNAVVCNIDRE